MINILGYQITKRLYESANILVYRGQRSADNQEKRRLTSGKQWQKV